MTPHIQTILGNGDENTAPGNCTQAALASLLDLPLEMVPHVLLFEDWYKATKLWLDGIGKRLIVYLDGGEEKEYWEYIGVPCGNLEDAPSGKMMLAAGQSHNGPWKHIVVWQDGKLVHDTHPNHKGLKGEPDEYWLITDKEK